MVRNMQVRPPTLMTVGIVVLAGLARTATAGKDQVDDRQQEVLERKLEEPVGKPRMKTIDFVSADGILYGNRVYRVKTPTNSRRSRLLLIRSTNHSFAAGLSGSKASTGLARNRETDHQAVWTSIL